MGTLPPGQASQHLSPVVTGRDVEGAGGWGGGCGQAQEVAFWRVPLKCDWKSRRGVISR